MNAIARLIAVLAAFGSVLLSAAPPRTASAVRARIEAVVASGKVPSMAVAVGRGDSLLWSGAFGYADKARSIAATPGTPYSIASVTKPFTATALMVLSERGQVSLDEPLARYLGPLRRPGVRDEAEVTLRRMLGHVAGFPLHHQFFYVDRLLRPLPFAQRMQCFGAEIASPGMRYAYSNLGFGALSEVVSRISGEPYGAFLAREVFEPLGLTGASVPESAADAAPGATRYGTDGQPLPFYVTDHEGASAIYASVDDLVRFGLFHAGTLTPSRPVLTAESRAVMQQPGPGGRGLAWSVNPDWHGRRVIWHSGAMPGSSATLWIVPEEHIAIALASNQFGAPVNRFAGEILADLLEVSLPADGRRGPADEGRAAPPLTARPADVRGRWRGRIGTCPGATEVTLDVRDRYDIGVTVGAAREQVAHSPNAHEGRVSGAFAGDGDMGPSRFRFDLEARGAGLEGPVTRSTGLGSRGNVTVTLWASLARQEQ